MNDLETVTRAAEYLIPLLREKALSGSSEISRLAIAEALRQSKWADVEARAAAMVLVGFGILAEKPKQPSKHPMLDALKQHWDLATWTVLPAVLKTPEPTTASTKADDVAEVIEKVMRAVDLRNRDVIRIVGDDTKGPKAKGIELLNLDSRFHGMTAAEFARVLGAKNIGRWFNEERAKAVKRWRERADRLD